MRHDNFEKIVISMYQFLEQNIGKNKLVTVAFVAKGNCVSIEKLEKCCKLVLGKSPKKIISEETVAKAIDLYVNANMSDQEISAMLGYSDKSSFCHFFKRNTGQPISIYSKNTILNNIYTDLNNRVIE